LSAGADPCTHYLCKGAGSAVAGRPAVSAKKGARRGKVARRLEKVRAWQRRATNEGADSSAPFDKGADEVSAPPSIVNLRRARRAARLSSYRVPYHTQDMDEVARRRDLAQQRYSRQHFHLGTGDAVDAAQLIVLAELVPARIVLRLG
jgi:hypothetical protein